MWRKRISLSALLLCVLISPAGAATPLSTLEEGQAGTIPFHSVTLNGRQFLQGVREGKPAVLSGDLQFPKSASGRIPAMLIVHGSDGITAGERQWADELRKIGVATFVMDSFSGRGIRETFSDQTRLATLAMIVDAYRALALLATHPRIDPNRIGIMGLSRGGIVSLWASFKRFQRMHSPPGLEFALYIPFYPSCNTRFIGDEDVSERPIRIFHGEADDQSVFSVCKEYVEQLRRAGKDVQITGYRGAYHAFDQPEVGRPRTYLSKQNWSRCFFDESKPRPDPAAYLKSCVTYGVTIGYDWRAHRDAARAVKEFLATTFNLDK